MSSESNKEQLNDHVKPIVDYYGIRYKTLAEYCDPKLNYSTICGKFSGPQHVTDKDLAKMLNAIERIGEEIKQRAIDKKKQLGL